MLYWGLSGSYRSRNQSRCWAKERGKGSPVRGRGVNCTTGPCVLVAQSADGDSEESVTITNPAAGNWMVLIDGFAVPAGTTTYNYVDVFVNAAFGSVGVTDANAPRPAGASWTAPGTVTVNAAPAAGRVLLGNVQVRTDTNVLIGQGDVVIQSVSP